MPGNTEDHTPLPPVPMIFILGNSHCGSTLLSFFLSSHPQIINLGEVKTRTWLKDRYCTCGHPVDQCQFYHGYFETFNDLKQKAPLSMRNTSPLQFLWRKRIPVSPSPQSAMHSLYDSLQDRIHQQYPEAMYWIDSSKSIWMLNAWLSILPSDTIRIIWLRRNTKATVSSFVKRGKSFLSAWMSIRLNDRMTNKFLKANKIPFLEVRYDRFYEHWADEAKRLSDFLQVNIPATYASHANHHVISGNEKTRTEFATHFNGLRKDEEWVNILRPYQKKLMAGFGGA